MKEWLVAATALAFGAATAVQAADTPPPWAYGFTTPVPPGTPPAEPAPQQVLDNVTLHTIPGSNFSFTRARIADRYGPADWFPEDHPAMPEIVAKGKVFAQPQVYACSLCHYPNGKGRPENANITGLTYEYFMQQMMDFRSGARKTSDPRKANTGLMTRFAQMMTDDEIKAAAQYFTAIPATPWITVVEGATVPKTKPQNGMFLTLEGEAAGVEPIGAGESTRQRVPTQPAIRLRRLCAAWQPQEGRGSGRERNHCRWQQGHRVHGLPRRRSARTRPGTNACGALAELSCAAAL
jgi:cytochrome c553